MTDQWGAQLHAAAAQWVETGRELGRAEASREFEQALSHMLDVATEHLDGVSTTGQDTLAAMAAWREGRRLLWQLVEEHRLHLRRERTGEGDRVTFNRKRAELTAERLLQQVRMPWHRRFGAALDAAATAWRAGL